MAEPGSGEYAAQHPVKNGIKKGIATTAALVTLAGSLSNPGKTEETTTTRVVQTTENKTITNEYPEIYARLFKDDPKAGELVNPSDVANEYNVISNLIKAGYRIEQPISEIGLASDDDDTTVNGVRTGGLGVHNEENVDLGLFRGTIYKKLLDTVFQDHHMQPPAIQVSGREAVIGEKIDLPNNVTLNLDTKALQEDVKYLRKIAKQKGTSVGQLFDEYNGIDGNLPPGNEKLQETIHNLLNYKEVIMTFNVTDEQGHIVKVVHKSEKPPAWFVPIADLTEEFQPNKPEQEKGAPRPQKIKAESGYGRVPERIKQPRAYNYTKGERGTRFPHDQHRSGRRQRPHS